MFPGLTELSSSGWKRDRIQRYIDLVTEGHSYDRKIKIKPIKFEKPLSDLDQMDIRGIRDLLKDFIAMGNSARRRGQICYIVFGVDDDWGYSGILDQSTQVFTQDKYKEYRETKSKFEELQMKIIARDFRDIVKQYIEPDLLIDYEFGWIQKEETDYLIGYVAFWPTPSELPYRIKYHSSLSLLGLHPGNCWTRRAESNEPVEGAGIAQLVAWQDIPFIPYSEWKKHLKRTANIVDQSESRGDQRRLLADLKLQIISAQDRLSNAAVEDIFDEVDIYVHGKHHEDNALYILGYGGCGKSTALREIARNMLKTLNDSLDILKNGTRNDQPNAPIPVFVDLKNFVPAHETLESYIVSHLRSIPLGIYEKFVKILRDPDLSFVIIFDSLDEIPKEQLKEAGLQVEQIVRHYHNVKFIIASRPYSIENVLKHSRVLFLEPFTPDQIKGRIDQGITHEPTKNALLSMLNTDIHLLHLLGIPRMLDACIVGVNQDKYVRVGDIIRQIMEAFLQREREILGYDNYQQFRAELNQLADCCWHQQLILAQQQTNLKFLIRFLQTGLIRESEDSNSLYFVSPHIRDFLLADQMQQDFEYRRKNIPVLKESPIEHRMVIHFLANWTQDDLSDSDIGSLIGGTNDPISILNIYLERRNSNLKGADDIYLALVEIGYKDLTVESVALMSESIRLLLLDPCETVFSITIDAILDYTALLDLCAEDILIELFDNETDSYRRHKLWPLVKGKSHLTTLQWLEYLALADNSGLNQVLIAELLESTELDWSDGYPADLPSLFISNVHEEIQLSILRKMKRTPDRIRSYIENLLQGGNAEINHEVRRILNLPLVMEPVHENPNVGNEDDKVAEDSYFAPSVLINLEKEQHQ